MRRGKIGRLCDKARFRLAYSCFVIELESLHAVLIVKFKT